MSNRNISLSEEGKKILDQFVDLLEVDRPQAIKIALAKGISESNGALNANYALGKKWPIPDNIIKDREYVLFKHLIITELNQPLSDEELHKYMLTFIEHGLRLVEKLHKNKTSMEDFRLMIL
ncbi:hypothetical protein GJU40_12965 [Bacillus lacus]|uniref:DUF1832 domain-containing protein n=1 Tax=Metabacillus lacus TaxID=1983721 RepID=A0A7X2J086_9BACI|nr:hypothetical protein [Metabacillus lacus]MRX73052.1 hypothetical protein [Metabacillus lacus]